MLQVSFHYNLCIITSVLVKCSYFGQDKAGCKMQMIQDGPYANAPEKPLRMSGLPECCEVRV